MCGLLKVEKADLHLKPFSLGERYTLKCSDMVAYLPLRFSRSLEYHQIVRVGAGRSGSFM